MRTTLNHAAAEALAPGAGIVSVALSALLLAAGCGRGSSPEPVPVGQISATVEGAFQGATPDLQSNANAVVSSIGNKDEARAFLELNNLASRPDLTPEQRSAANRSIISLNEKLRSAAAEGDQRAAEALQIYRSSK